MQQDQLSQATKKKKKKTYCWLIADGIYLIVT